MEYQFRTVQCYGEHYHDVTESSSTDPPNRETPPLSFDKREWYKSYSWRKSKDSHRWANQATEEALARSKKTLVQPQFPGLKNQKVRTVSKNRSAKISQSVRELLNAKDSQIEHLQKLLESERARLAEVREDKENRQAIPMDIQKVFRQLSQVSEVLKNFLRNSVEQLDQKRVFEKFSRILDRK